MICGVWMSDLRSFKMTMLWSLYVGSFLARFIYLTHKWRIQWNYRQCPSFWGALDRFVACCRFGFGSKHMEILKQTLVHRYIMNIFMIHISICTQKILEKQLYLCRRGLKAVARAKHISGTRIMSITKGTQQYQNSHSTLVDVCPPWLGALRRSFERAEGIWVMHIEPHACFKYTPVNQHSNGSNGKWTIWLVDLFYIE